MKIKVIHRQIASTRCAELEKEFRAVNQAHHKLLDFEFEHQAIMDAVAPRLNQVSRILAKLKRRERWAERAQEGRWTPALRQDLRPRLDALRLELKAERDSSPEWKAARDWPNDRVGEPKQARRKAGETDEEFTARAGKNRTRREQYRVEQYSERTCYWASWNGVVQAVDQAVQTVIKTRAQGLSAKLRRPRFFESGRLVIQASAGGFELLDVARKSLTFRIRVADGWVTLKTRGRAALPKLPADYSVREVEILRRKEPSGKWRYTTSLTIAGDWQGASPGPGAVGIDTGHRQFEDGTIRAFAWYGSDGQKGEVRLPPECVAGLERARRLQQTADIQFVKMGLPYQNRAQYRAHLRRLGVRTEEQQLFISDDQHLGMRMAAANKRARHLRETIYTREVRQLSKRYRWMGIDIEGKAVQRMQKDQGLPSSILRSRNLVAAYSIKQTCERYGVCDTKAKAAGSTTECPLCGQHHKNTSKLNMFCTTKAVAYDQDYAAAYNMLCRAVVIARQEVSK